MNLFLITQDNVARAIPVAAPLLERAIAFTHGQTTMPELAGRIIAGHKQLWLVCHEEDGKPKPVAAGTTSLVLNDDGTKTANIELLSGEDMKTWFSLKSVFESWAKDEGCKDVRMYVRKGLAKHLTDYTLTHYVLRKELVS